MSDSRRLRHDLVAVVLLLVGLVVAVAVFSRDAADQPGATVFPAHTQAANLVGAPGASIAAFLDETLGVAVHVLLASWFVLVILLLLRRHVGVWLMRLCGWLILIPCSALAADYFGPAVFAGPPAGPGGSIGACLYSWLSEAIDPIGQGLVFGGVLLVGLALALDFLVVGFPAALCRGGWWMAGAVCRAAVKHFPRIRMPERRKEVVPTTQDEELVKHEKPATPTADSGIIPIHHAGHVPISGRAAEEERFADYELPGLGLLDEPQVMAHDNQDQLLRDRAVLLEKTFTDFGLKVRVVGIHTGPVITQYELALETGLRVAKVTSLSDDLALCLKVPSVRIVAPIPGKNTVGIEVPNEHRAKVRLKEVILASGVKTQGKYKLPLFLGKDTEGRPLVYDLAEMPHLLIAGRTGTGKSVAMNALIISLLMTRRPDEVKMIMIDPKMLEMSEYSKIPHLMHPVVKDMKKAEAILSWAVDKMEERYDILSRARVRNIAGYNELSPEEIQKRVKPADEEEKKRVPDRMPYIVIFIDEMADLMMTMKKEVEGHIIRLAQKSRAAGIHLVVATQKPTVDVITGLIKSNLPARICFQVSSRTDSRVVLDECGADKLLGKGDMLFLVPGTSTLIRAQGTFLSDQEIQQVVESLEGEPCFAQELVGLHSGGGKEGGSFLESLRARDDMYEQAIEVVVREGRGSVSLLQRALGIGYGRGARLIDFMAEDGIVGTYNGSQARDVLYTPEQWEDVKQAGRMAQSA